MTIDDMPTGTYDLSKGGPRGPKTGVGITAVPGIAPGARNRTARLRVRTDNAPWATAYVEDPDRPSGMVRGSVRVLDQGNGARFGPELFITAKGGRVWVDAKSGRFTYTPSLPARQAARLRASGADKVDDFTITVTDLHGRSTDTQITVDILEANVPPIGRANIDTPFDSGAVFGRVEGTSWDGADLTFSLANSSNPDDSTEESAYSRDGGLVQLDTGTGKFIFIPQLREAGGPDPDTDTFVVTATDAQGGSVNIAVVAPAHLKLDARTTGTAPDLQYGRLVVTDDGPLTFELGIAPVKGTVLVNPDGSYSYVRTPGLGQSGTAEDSFTIVGIDGYGRTVTVAKVPVSPPLSTTAPVAGSVRVTGSRLDCAGVQTTTGMVTAVGAARFVTNTVASARGGEVRINADGTFTYSTARNPAIGHDAAVLNARAEAKIDSFTVIAEDASGAGLAVVATVALHPWNNTPTQSTIGASGRMRGLPTGDWTTTVVDVDGDDITWTVHQPNPRGFVMMARTAHGKWAVHYESMSPRSGARHPRETFTVRYRDGHVKRDGTPAFVEATYEF